MQFWVAAFRFSFHLSPCRVEGCCAGTRRRVLDSSSQRTVGTMHVFCHVTGLKDGEGSVDEGDTVRFKVSYDDRKGKDRAVDVVRSGGGGGRRRSRSRDGKYGGGSRGGGKGGDTRPGDWECPGCGINVLPRRTSASSVGNRNLQVA